VARQRTETEIAAAAADPAYTPSVAEVPALLDLLGRAEDETLLIGALLRQPAAADAARARLAEAGAAALRPRLVQLLGRFAAARPELVSLVAALTGDSDPKSRRNAIIALGRLPGPASEAALLGLLRDRQTSLPHLRSAVESLGKIGGRDALAALPRAPADAELARITARARLRLERTLGRGSPSAIDAAAAPAGPLAIVFTCRVGLESLVADELGPRFAARVDGRGHVAGRLRGPLDEVFRARTFDWLGFPIALAGADAAAALASDAALAVLRTFTTGAIRYRWRFAAGGHRRAEVQRLAAAVAARRPELMNDPTDTTWTVEIHGRELLLVPRRLDDPRFAWRRRDVPAASHPTLAAALARIAGARPDDVVWDPFVGSGAELIERARLGPARRLVGTDIDADALGAARANLAAAGVTAELAIGDALLAAPPARLTLILTNPPMGRRVARPDLARFVDRAASALLPGGRLVWISPTPGQTAARAARAGLCPTYRQIVDMNGFSAEIQAFERPVTPSRRSPSTSTPPRSRA
jgi:23S rRNA G2445 N2-methylase RlmL